MKWIERRSASVDVSREPCGARFPAQVFKLLLGFMLFVAFSCGYPDALQGREATSAKRIMDLMLLDDAGAELIRGGESIVGSGSWISGKKYADPLKMGTSDHDMRLLMSEGLTQREMIERYKDVKRELTRRIRAEFGPDDAEKILRKTTLYPPEQLLSEVESMEQAVKRFRDLGLDSPNLGGQPLEGYYSKGRGEFLRSVEARSGRVFYRGADNKIRSGMADILSDKVSGAADTIPHTLMGATSNARAISERAMLDLVAGDGRALTKQLERVEAALMKGQGFAGLPRDQSEAFKKLMAEIKKNPDLYAFNRTMRQKVMEYTRQANLRATLLEKLRKANSRDRELITRMLKEMNGSTSTGSRILQAFEKVPVQEIGRAVDVLFTAYTAYMAYGKYQDGDVDGALRDVGVQVVFKSLGLGPGLVATMMNMMIEEGIALGSAFFEDYLISLTGTQDCDDLLAGLFTVKGREVNVLDGSAPSMSIEDLAREYQHVEDARRVIGDLIRRATTRGFGRFSIRVGDEFPREELEKRCEPYILFQWHRARMRMEEEFLARYVALQDALMVLEVTPDPAEFEHPELRNTVRVGLNIIGVDFLKSVGEMERSLDALAGRGNYIFPYSIHWYLDGKEVGGRNDLSIAFDVAESGSHTVEARMEIYYTPYSNSAYRNFLLERIEKSVSATVDVVVREKTKVTIEEPRERVVETTEDAGEAEERFVAHAGPDGEYYFEWDFGDGSPVAGKFSLSGSPSVATHTYKGLKDGDTLMPKVTLLDTSDLERFLSGESEPLAEDAIRIRVALSEFRVPDVLGMKEPAAKDVLKKAGFSAETTNAHHEKIPKGHVIEQSPKAGKAASPGSAVGLKVSLGPKLKKGIPITGVFKPYGMKPTIPTGTYFDDYIIQYTVSGASATKKEYVIGQIVGRVHYSGVRVDENAGSVRVHGTVYGEDMGNHKQYAGRIIVEIKCGMEGTKELIPINRGSSGPYSFDVSIPVSAEMAGAQVSFSIVAGMHWPNGFFSISVNGN